MKINRNHNRIETTLGELIAAVSEAAFEYSDDAKEAYSLTRLTLAEILKSSLAKSKSMDWRLPVSKYLH